MRAVLVHDGHGDDFKAIEIDGVKEFIVEDGKLWVYAGTQDGQAFYAEKQK